MSDRRIYVASSWRNDIQPVMVESLRGLGHQVYDFKNPREGDDGFHWSEVMPSYSKDGGGSQLCDQREYVDALDHPVAVAGFESDYAAMEWADTFVLVLPCGRSAHLELGWAAGYGKRTAIFLDGPMVTPELMYKMVDHIATDFHSLFCWLRDDPPPVLSEPPEGEK